MSDRQSKRRSRGQFLPRVLCLEDRAVPATFFVDPALSTAATDDTVVFNSKLPGQEVSGLIFANTFADYQANTNRTAFDNFTAALQAANFNPGPDTIRVAGSTSTIPLDNAGVTPDTGTSGNALVVTGDLTIQGSGQGATILAPTGDTTFSGAADPVTAIIRAAGPDLTVTDLTLDAAGKQVGFGFDIGDGTTATFDRVTIRNVQFDLGTVIEGTAIVAFDGDPADADAVVVNVQNSTITNSGLHGVSIDNADGQVSATTIIGRGFDEHTNAQNGVQIVGDATVHITGSTISGNLGGGVSSGVAVAEDPITGAAPTVTLIGNELTGNTIGLTVGTKAGDDSVVTARFNNIAGNFQGVDADQNVPGVSAINNFWGSPTGPFNAVNNPGGTGNSVTDNVVISPFLTGPTPVIPAADEAAYIAAISTVGVAVSPAPGQTEPVPSGPVLFQVVFAEPVTGFDAADVTVVSSPPGSTPAVSVTGSGTTYTVSVTGLAGFGEVAIQVPAGVATGASGFRNAASGVASVDFGVPPNTAPQISAIANQTTQVGTATTPAGFTVTDTETPEANLIVTATSNNQAVVPNGAIVLGGAGANRTISVTPIAEGQATITVTVQDASGATGSTTFTVTSNPPNTAPTITAIGNQSAPVNTASTPGAFTIGDAQTPAGQLTVTVSSSNQAVVPNANILLGGSGANRTVSVTPIAEGTSTITVTVSDGTLSTSTTFTATGTQAGPTPPTLSALNNQSSAVNTPSDTQSFTIGDAQTPADQLTVTATSSTQGVVPNANITLGGSGANRTIRFTPIGEGTSTITVTVTDADGQSTSGTFVALGTAVPPPPTGTVVLIGTEEFAAGPGFGGGPVVNYYNPDGSTKFSATVFAAGFTGGVRTAVGDFNGDGVPDVAVGTGPGSVTAVRVLDGANPDNELFRVVPFEERFTGGVYVAANDVTGDGKADLIITPDEGGGPRVRVFSGGDAFGLVADFLGIEDPNFRGGARAAASDVNGDGVADLLVAAGFGGGPRLAGFDGKSLATGPVKIFADFFVFEQTLRNGVFIAGGDVNGDGFADVIAGGGPGGGPRVFAVSGKDILTNTQVQVANFFAGNTANRGGIRVTAKDLDNDNRADIVTGSGAGGGSRLTAYAGSTIPADGTPPELFAFDAFPGFNNGIYVG